MYQNISEIIAECLKQLFLTIYNSANVWNNYPRPCYKATEQLSGFI